MKRILVLAAVFTMTWLSNSIWGQDLPSGTTVLVQTNTDVKFYPATIVKKILDGYRVKFEDGT